MTCDAPAIVLALLTSGRVLDTASQLAAAEEVNDLEITGIQVRVIPDVAGP